MSKFRERYGLDYMKKPYDNVQAEQEDTKGDLPRGMEEALIVHSRPVLEMIKSQPDNTAKIFNIAKKLVIRIDVLLPVVKYLISKGYLVRTIEDPQGNDTLKLAEAGNKLL